MSEPPRARVAHAQHALHSSRRAFNVRQDLRLDAGTAFDLTARRLQTTYETHPEAKRTVATASYTVTIANAKDSAATVDVLEQRGGEWSVVTSSLPAEKVSSTLTRFRVKVPARGEATLTYRVRVVW